MNDGPAEETGKRNSSPSSSETELSSRRRTLLPTRSFWVLVILSVGAFVAARALHDDPSVGLIVALGGIHVCGFYAIMWFCFRSVYSKGVRRIVVVSMLGLIAATLATVRVESFSGSLMPTLRFVWSKAHDETLGDLETGDSAGIDLTMTTDRDFPQFLGPNRNGVLTGTNLSRNWRDTPPRELWRCELGAGWSGFSVVNGYAVTMEQRGENELVSCYSVETGEPLWNSSVATRHQSPLGFLGPRSTPTIHNGRVYAQGAAGILRCLDGATGRTIWQRDLFAEMNMTQDDAEGAVAWGRANSPLVADEKLIVAIGGPRDGKCVNVAALDLETGETVWEGSDHQISYASPMAGTLLGTEQVVVVNEGSVSGHDLQTGNQLWEFPRPGDSSMDANCSQPQIVDDSHLLVSKGYGAGAELIRLSKSSDNQWEADSEWDNRRALKTKFSNVSIVDGYAYALDDGVLCCLEIESGERMWKKGRYKYGQILAVDDLLLILGEFGELSLVEASPEGHVKLASIQALEGQTWNTLCLTGKRLLLRNAKEAVCYELP